VRHLLFRTGRFNLSQVHEHFINPCCFGEDLAAWLQAKLADRDLRASDPGQEDWGWYVRAKQGDDSYFLAVSGNSENGTNQDYGEWQIIVLRKRSIWDRIRGKRKIEDNDPMLQALTEILRAEPDFVGVHAEASARRTHSW
jgi:hypothetical protein